jgi:hypothetical protein
MMSDASAPAEGVEPLPGLRATMAGLVASGAVAYAAGSATWYEGPGEQTVARRWRGRTLRELRRDELIEVDESAAEDARGARPVRLTELGAARHAVSAPR